MEVLEFTVGGFVQRGVEWQLDRMEIGESVGAGPEAVEEWADWEFRPFCQPKDFTDPPRPLVALLGEVDTHRLIIQNLPRRHALVFLSAELDHVFPADPFPADDGPAPAVAPEDFAGGLLPLDWLAKQQQYAPAVAVLLFQWEPSPEAEDRVAAAVEAFRKANPSHSRGFREIVVLVRASTGPGAAGATDPASAGAGTVWRRAGLPSKKSVFLLNTSGALMDSLSKLEALILNSASEYFKSIVRLIKRQKELLPPDVGFSNRVSVRVNAQVGIVAQIYGDVDMAIQSFNAAYESLRKLQSSLLSTSLDVLELRNVAYMLATMILKLLLQVGKYNEAVEVFTAHIQWFKEAVGPPSLSYRYYAWMSQQYKMFGELLEVLNLTTSTTNRLLNSSYFFHVAAENANKRRQTAQVALSSSTSSIDASIAEAYLKRRQFYGQLGQSEKGLDHSLEVASSLFLEARVSHGDDVLELYTRAYKSAKKLGAQRLILFYGRQMAAEYFLRNEVSVAKRLYDNIIEMYRNENWLSLLKQVLQESLECSKLLGLHTDSLKASLDLLGINMQLPRGQRERLHRECFQLFETIQSEYVEKPQDFSILINPSLKLVEAEVQFNTFTVEVGKPFQIKVKIRSFFYETIAVSEIDCLSSSDSLVCSMIDLGTKYELIPGTSATLIQNLSLSNVIERFSVEKLKLRLANHNKCILFVIPQEIPVISVVPPVAHVQMRCIHDPPAIVGEFYKMTFQLKLDAKEDTMQEVVARVSAETFPESKEDVHILYVQEVTDSGTQFLPLKFSTAYQKFLSHTPLNSNDYTNIEIYLFCHEKCVVQIYVETRVIDQHKVAVPLELPFSLNFSRLNNLSVPRRLDMLSDISTYGVVETVVNDTCFLWISLANDSQHDLKLISILPQSSEDSTVMKFDESSLDLSFVNGNALIVVTCFDIFLQKHSEKIPLGFLRIGWLRSSSSEDSVPNEASILLPSAEVLEPPVTAKILKKGSFVVGESFEIHVLLKSNSDWDEEVLFDLDYGSSSSSADEKEARRTVGEGLLVCGKKQGSVTVLSNQEECLVFRVIPTSAGVKSIPMVKVRLPKYQLNLLPTSSDAMTVFVHPPSQTAA